MPERGVPMSGDSPGPPRTRRRVPRPPAPGPRSGTPGAGPAPAWSPAAGPRPRCCRAAAAAAGARGGPWLAPAPPAPRGARGRPAFSCSCGEAFRMTWMSCVVSLPHQPHHISLTFTGKGQAAWRRGDVSDSVPLRAFTLSRGAGARPPVSSEIPHISRPSPRLQDGPPRRLNSPDRSQERGRASGTWSPGGGYYITVVLLGAEGARIPRKSRTSPFLRPSRDDEVVPPRRQNSAKERACP